ncbi:MAG: GDSL-type esterase/lipase family protein [Solirubrobacteraceae bacterium]
MTIIDESHRCGILAFGDSITNGGGELQWGVALQSWVQWVARGLGLPFTNYAVDGARAVDVATRQIPAYSRLAVRPDARYDLGCLYIGVNDVRALDWEPTAFAADHDLALRFLSERCDAVLAVTIPLDLGSPRAGAKVVRANAIIEQGAHRHRALILDLRGFGARNLLMADQVHPTALGQINIAERALATLDAAGIEVKQRPSALVEFRPSAARRLQGDWTYLYRRLKLAARILAWRPLSIQRKAGRPPR